MKKFLLTILLAIITSTTLHATRYISDMLLIGGTWDEVCAVEKTFQQQGWETINKDLNNGCGEESDYIYLMVKYEESNKDINYGYVTDVLLYNGIPDEDIINYNGAYYTLTPYFGGSHFKYKKGNLNSNTGLKSDDVYLFYTKKPMTSKETLTSIYFNGTKSGAIGKNGSKKEGYNINTGTKGAEIYMHVTAGTKTYTPSGSGTEEDPIIISSAAEWATFASKTSNGDYMERRQYVKLASDIPNESEKAAGNWAIDNMVGQTVPAWMYLDGDGHTMTVDIKNVIKGTAPICYAYNCRIENLTVKGDVTSTDYHAAGLIGLCEGTIIIDNCHVSADVESPTFAGGIVGHGGSGTLLINKSYYDGTIWSFTKYAGGLMGWCDELELYIYSSLFKGSFEPGKDGLYHPIACKNDIKDVTISGQSYYLGVDTMNIGKNSIPGLKSYKVSPEPIPNVKNKVFTAPDGNTYYYEYASSTMEQVVKDFAGKKASMEFDVSVTKGFMKMICFPIKMSSAEHATLYKLDTFSMETVGQEQVWIATFNDVTPAQNQFLFSEPDMPYLLLSDTTGIISFTGEIDCVPSTVDGFQPIELDGGNGWTMKGVYSDTQESSINGYLYQCGKALKKNITTGTNELVDILVDKEKNSSLSAFQAYISYNPENIGETAPSKVYLKLVDKNGKITAVGTLNTVTGEITIDRWFSLDGKPLTEEPTEPGFYIHNGKKVAITNR